MTKSCRQDKQQLATSGNKYRVTVNCNDHENAMSCCRCRRFCATEVFLGERGCAV